MNIMSITDGERRAIIVRRLERLRDDIRDAAYLYDRLIGGEAEHQEAREKFRLKLAEIADGLRKACD